MLVYIKSEANSFLKEELFGAGKIAWCGLRALVALADDLGLVPSTHLYLQF